jgi:hypothetical protein
MLGVVLAAVVVYFPRGLAGLAGDVMAAARSREAAK